MKNKCSWTNLLESRHLKEREEEGIILKHACIYIYVYIYIYIYIYLKRL
jgi:hypothetical protein